MWRIGKVVFINPYDIQDTHDNNEPWVKPIMNHGIVSTTHMIYKTVTLRTLNLARLAIAS
jgi:hypothetical protein